jgi:hypothetical protein
VLLRRRGGDVIVIVRVAKHPTVWYHPKKEGVRLTCLSSFRLGCRDASLRQAVFNIVPSQKISGSDTVGVSIFTVTGGCLLFQFQFQDYRVRPEVFTSWNLSACCSSISITRISILISPQTLDTSLISSLDATDYSQLPRAGL